MSEGTGAARVPRAALALGASGLIPFVTGAAALWAIDSIIRLDAVLSLFLGYSAVILSFMGAIHWGVALNADRASMARSMTLSVLPALIGWVALALPPQAALVLFAAAFVGVYLLDEAALRRGLMPAWYRSLRQPLTAVVVICQLAAFAALSA